MTTDTTLTEPTNDLIHVMKTLGIEVRLLGTEENPTPESEAMCDMLLEICRLREEARIVAERAATVPSDEAIRKLFWEGSDKAATVTTDIEVVAGVRNVLAALQPTEDERIKAMALAYDQEYHRAPEGSERRDWLQACHDSMAQALAVGGVGEGAK